MLERDSYQKKPQIFGKAQKSPPNYETLNKKVWNSVHTTLKMKVTTEFMIQKLLIDFENIWDYYWKVLKSFRNDYVVYTIKCHASWEIFPMHHYY